MAPHTVPHILRGALDLLTWSREYELGQGAVSQSSNIAHGPDAAAIYIGVVPVGTRLNIGQRA